MTIRELERISTQTVLGVRFWDAARDTVVVDGLDVRAWLLSANRPVGRVVRGRPTANGVYAFFGLYRSAENLPASTPPGEQLWEQVPDARRAVVEVRDPLGRYLSVAFQVQVPFRGAFRGEGTWLAQPLLLPPPPAGQARGVQLWPAAGYAIPPGLTVLRALVVVGSDDDPPPASYALAEVLRLDADDNPVTHAFGLTDEHGRLTVPLRYPPIPDPPIPDPPEVDPDNPDLPDPEGSEDVVYPTLSEQGFRLFVRFTSRPDPLPEPPTEPPWTLPGSSLPNLEALFDQAVYHVARQHDGGELILVDELSATLRYGPPLILRTATPEPDRPEAVLRIAPE